GNEGIYEEDIISAVAAQLAAWKERLEMNVVIFPTCNTCGATHSTEGCPFANDDVQYMEQYNYPQQNYMYSNTYNPDRWDYPNFLGSNDQNIRWSTNLLDFSQPMQQFENESSLEEDLKMEKSKKKELIRLKPCQMHRLQRVTWPARVTGRVNTAYAVLRYGIIESYTAKPCNRARQHGLIRVGSKIYRELHG
ncbi:hypothetical protein ACLOJK_038996, partial [Asimina triloba]